MMRAWLASLLICGFGWAAPAAAQDNAASPLLGRWALEVERLEMPDHMRPRSVTYSFSVAADGKWASNVEIVTGDGTTVRATSVAALNGVPAEVESPMVDIAALSLPQPDVLVMALANKGAALSTRIYTVSKDGQTMTETGTQFSPEGIPSVQTSYFHRVR